MFFLWDGWSIWKYCIWQISLWSRNLLARAIALVWKIHVSIKKEVDLRRYPFGLLKLGWNWLKNTVLAELLWEKNNVPAEKTNRTNRFLGKPNGAEHLYPYHLLLLKWYAWQCSCYFVKKNNCTSKSLKFMWPLVFHPFKIIIYRYMIIIQHKNKVARSG